MSHERHSCYQPRGGGGGLMAINPAIDNIILSAEIFCSMKVSRWEILVTCIGTKKDSHWAESIGTAEVRDAAAIRQGPVIK